MTNHKNNSTVLITGAGRGLGQDLAGVFGEKGWTVFPVVRTRAAADSLKAKLAHDCHPIIGDITSNQIGESIRNCLRRNTDSLQVLINNAGVSGTTPFIDDVDPTEVAALFDVHCLGALRCVQAALPWLRAAFRPIIINVTSRMGSLAKVAAGEFAAFNASYSYRIAKAAQNMLTVCLGQELAREKVSVLAVHPGRLTTGFGCPDADTSSRLAAEKMYQVIVRKDTVDRPYFDLISGERFPW